MLLNVPLELATGSIFDRLNDRNELEHWVKQVLILQMLSVRQGNIWFLELELRILYSHVRGNLQDMQAVLGGGKED